MKTAIITMLHMFKKTKSMRLEMEDKINGTWIKYILYFQINENSIHDIKMYYMELISINNYRINDQWIWRHSNKNYLKQRPQEKKMKKLTQ